MKRGTSFSSLESSDILERNRGSFLSISDDISDFYDESKRSSITSFSLHSSPTASLCSFNTMASDIEFSMPERSPSQRRSLSPVMEASSSSKHSAGSSKIWKKLPFHRKVHPEASKQKSLVNGKDARENLNGIKSICTGDLTKTTEMLERLREKNSELAMEVIVTALHRSETL